MCCWSWYEAFALCSCATSTSTGVCWRPIQRNNHLSLTSRTYQRSTCGNMFAVIDDEFCSRHDYDRKTNCLGCLLILVSEEDVEQDESRIQVRHGRSPIDHILPWELSQSRHLRKRASTSFSSTCSLTDPRVMCGISTTHDGIIPCALTPSCCKGNISTTSTISYSFQTMCCDRTLTSPSDGVGSPSGTIPLEVYNASHTKWT